MACSGIRRRHLLGTLGQGHAVMLLGACDRHNIAIEWRFTHEGPGGQFADLAAELVARPVQVIVAITTPAVVAAAQVTKSIPIVTGFSRDLVELGLAQSYARPGGNVTGTGSNAQVYGKLLELPKDTVPTLSRVGCMYNPTTAGTRPQTAQARADGLPVSGDLVFNDPRATAPPQRYGVPAVYSQVPGYVDHGGLLGYSIDVDAAIRRSGAYVDKILKGANPADLPIEEAMSFEMGINLKTARELGLAIPDSVMLQVTQVFQ